MKKNLNFLSALLIRTAASWQAALTIAIIMVPVALALAIASHATPASGIVACIWAGIVGTILSSSNYTIFGPTGAVTGFLASYAVMKGACDLPMLAVIAGIAIIGIYIAKLEKHIALIPTSAVHGFTLGTAVIIIGGQINFAFGLSGLTKHERFLNNIYESLTHLSLCSSATFFVFASALSLLYILLFLMPRVPGVIVISILGIIIGFISQNNYFNFVLSTIGTTFGVIPGSIIQPFTFCLNSRLIFTGSVIGVIALLETLIAARVADRLTETKHDRRRETLSLGVANIVAGFCGGIPVSTPIGRVVFSINAGMKDKIAHAINAVFVAIIAIFFLPYFSYLPLAIVAAMMVFFCIRMVEREQFKYLYHHDRKNFWLSLVVAGICIIENPILGLFAGTALAYIFKINKKEQI